MFDFACVGGSLADASFAPNQGTGNAVTGTVDANMATVMQTADGVPGNVCSVQLESNKSCLCVGDCNTNADVTVDELLSMINIALGNADATQCVAGDSNLDHQITIDEILAAVNNALNGCPQPPLTLTNMDPIGRQSALGVR